MTFKTRPAVRWLLVGAAAFSITACASRKQPPVTQGPPPAPTGPGTATPGGPATPGYPGGPVTGTPGAAIPGSVQDFVINAGERVYFDTDQYQVRSDAGPVLDAQAAWLQRFPNVRVIIEGNADERGTREYNLALGARRANAVRDYLVARGVNAARIETVSYGKERPIDPGSGEDAWSRNRNARTGITAGAQ